MVSIHRLERLRPQRCACEVRGQESVQLRRRDRFRLGEQSAKQLELFAGFPAEDFGVPTVTCRVIEERAVRIRMYRQ